jgi:hypothetical protein
LQHRSKPRPAVLRLAVALSFGLLTISFGWQVPTVRAAGAANAQANELVRLINVARASAGKPLLLVDPFLASKARDGAIPCPDDATKTIPGRARDFAAYSQLSHSLRLCNADTYTLSGTKFVNVLQGWGYSSVGENNLVNGGYGTAKYLYSIGSRSTYTYATTGRAMVAWKTSQTHWSIIVGGYDRVGCGSWSPSGSTFYYDCLFSYHGASPSGLTAAPTKSPFPDVVPAPTDAPAATSAPLRTPTATRPPVTVRTAPPAATNETPASPDGSVAPEPTAQEPATPSQTPTSAVAGIVSATAEPARQEAPVAVQGAGGVSAPSDTLAPDGLTREAALGFLAGALGLVAFWVLLDRARRRRRSAV